LTGEGGEEEREGGGDAGLIVADCSLNFYTVCAAGCYGIWGDWIMGLDMTLE